MYAESNHRNLTFDTMFCVTMLMNLLMTNLIKYIRSGMSEHLTVEGYHQDCSFLS